jgi:hypothetical protein
MEIRGIHVDKMKSYPNPASDYINIDYYLYDDTKLAISIFDLKGRLVKEIINNRFYEKGKYNIQLETDILHSGVYLLKLQTNSSSMIEKIQIIHH